MTAVTAGTLMSVARLEACLVDAYDTIVTCDFSVLRKEVPALAGISADIWHDEYSRLGALLTDGRMSKAQAFGQILQTSGLQARSRPGRARWCAGTRNCCSPTGACSTT